MKETRDVDKEEMQQWNIDSHAEKTVPGSPCGHPINFGGVFWFQKRGLHLDRILHRPPHSRFEVFYLSCINTNIAYSLMIWCWRGKGHHNLIQITTVWDYAKIKVECNFLDILETCIKLSNKNRTLKAFISPESTQSNRLEKNVIHHYIVPAWFIG